MDAFVLTRMFDTKEKFEDGPVDTKTKISRSILLILSLSISAYASYLAWTCSNGDHMYVRILTTMLAWFFGVIYILWFTLFKANACKILLEK
jgi:hypothetical protein